MTTTSPTTDDAHSHRPPTTDDARSHRPHTTGAGDARSYRLSSIDMLRGLVIVVMALDHTRDYFMAGAVFDPLRHPGVGAGLYLTRWVTHFCAPVFVALAGVSAGLMLARKTHAALGAFLFKRGCWLIVVELAVISTALTFAPFGIPQMDGAVVLIFQVIWAIGAGMIVLSGAQFLGARACLMLGAVVLLGHNMLDAVWPRPDAFAPGAVPLWVGLHTSIEVRLGPVWIDMLYPLIAWAGVMLFGFGAAGVFQRDPVERDAILRKVGMAFIACFVVLRVTGVYGDGNPWQMHDDGALRTVFDVMNVTKYPPSLLYLLITLGPMLILCSYADRMRGRLKDMLVMFGRVPFAFYVPHFFLIHLLSVAYGMLSGFEASQMMTLVQFYPDGYGFGLGGVYLMWLAVVAMLYPLCRWFAGVKRRRNDWWLSYV